MEINNYFWKPLKINEPAETTWVWSDPHLGHKSEHWAVPLWKDRGFNSCEDHDRILIDERWNGKVSNNDSAFLLGDTMFGINGEERILNTLRRMNFKSLYLMGGNHHAGFKNLIQKAEIKDGVFQLDLGHKTVYFLPNYFEVIVGRKPFVLSHYALFTWNGQAKGSILVFGHSHSNLRRSEMGARFLSEVKAEEVCVESHPAPINFQYLIDKFKSRGNVTYDHHDSNTLNPF